MATLETLGTLQRRLNFDVPVSEIEPEVDARLRKLARTTRMPGFRPGKVPMKMVQQTYGAQTYAEVVGDVVSRKLDQAIGEHQLRIAGEPQIERREGEVPADALAFSATFEVFPEIELAEPSTLELERFACEVGDAEIDKTLEILRKQRVEWEEAGRAAQDGDRVTIDFKGTLDGEAFAGGSAEDFPFVLGEGRMLPDFETGVRGLSAGETKEIDVAFPADYGSKDLAGRTARFQLTAKKVEAPKLPEVDAEFAKVLGVENGDLEKMRADIKSNLEREVKGRVRNRTKAGVMEKLPELAKLELPKALVEGESRRMAQQMREDLQQRGMDAKNLPEIPADAFTEQAEKRVRLGLIVGDLVKRHNLQAKPDQLRAQIEEFAQAYENPAEVVRWYFSDRQRLADVEALVIEQNVVDWLLSSANVKETTLAFDELMDAQQQR